MEGNVLLVDGVAAYRTMLAGRLGGFGCAVFEAGTAAGARSHVAARAFDVAVVDNCLPDEEGVTLVMSLVDGGCGAKFVLVLEPTEDALNPDDAAAQSGASVVVRGPVHPNALIQIVRGILGGRAATTTVKSPLSSSPPGPDARPLGAGRAAVLVASGDAETREHISSLLRTRGAAVFAIGERAKLAGALEQLRPQLAIIDAELSDAHGFEVCRQLRTIDPWRDLPILLLISNGDPAGRRACFEAGGDDFVEKPISEAELLARVEVRVELRLLLDDGATAARS